MKGKKCECDPLQSGDLLYFRMNLTPYRSSEKIKKREIVSCLSRQFIDTAFEYERELIETKHRHKMNRLRAMGYNAPNKNNVLKREKLMCTAHMELLQKELKDSKASLKSDKDKILDLKEVVSGIVNGWAQRKPLSKEFLLRCKHRICDMGL